MPPETDWSAGSLLKTMDRFGIAEACPASGLAEDYVDDHGNRQLLEECQNHDRFHPVWIVSPHYSGEFPRPDVLLEQLASHNVRLVKMVLNSLNGYLSSLDVPQCTALFDALAAARVPIIFDFYDFASIRSQTILDVRREWPELSMILTFPKIAKQTRMLSFLFEECDNLHITLSGYQLMGGIEHLVDRFGAGVLIYGSHYPFFTPLQSMMQLIYSDITDHDKKLIAGGTLRRLMQNAFPK